MSTEATITVPIYTPAQLEKYFAEERAKLTDEQFYKPSARALRDVWMAARFGRGYSRCIGPCRLAIDAGAPDSADDFYLHARGKRFPFQSTEVGIPGRRRGDEPRSRHRLDPNANPDLGTNDAPIWIANALSSKVRKRYSHAKDLNVLLYLNIPAQQVQFEAVRSACANNLSKFKSVWALTDRLIGCLHPDADLGVLDGWAEIDLSPTPTSGRTLSVTLTGSPIVRLKKKK